MFGVALFFISYFVYLRLLFKKSAWGLIALYWGVLVLKNAVEMVGGI